MTCKEFSQRIDRYLGGKLCEEEQEAFESHYFQCHSCFTQLKMVERLISKEVQIKTGTAASMMPPAWWLNWKPLLAMAALFMVVILTIWQIAAVTHKKALYRISAVPAPVYMVTETRNSHTAMFQQQEAYFDQAMSHYQQQNYSRALELLQQIPVTTPNARITFFLGICYLYTDHLESAMGCLDSILDAMNPSYYDEALYYKAITLIRLDKKNQALKLLQNLADMFSPYSPRAQELIQKLN